MIVIYHGSCHDGFCAAWLLSKIYPDAEFLPYQYGVAPPDVADQDVVVADFSFPLNDTVEMIKNSKSFLCFDHHDSVCDELKALPQFIFDNDKSGARLVWEHYFARASERPKGAFDGSFTRSQLDHFEGLDVLPIPWLVRYTEDRDLWRFRLKFSKEVNSGLRMEPFNFAVWDDLSLEKVMESGRVLQRYFVSRAERAADNAKYVFMRLSNRRLYRVPCVNVTNPDEISLVGETLALRDDADFGMTYFYDGSEFCYSLRSRGEFDVSEVAKFFGGGGHKNAAGFRIPEMFNLVDG